MPPCGYGGSHNECHNCVMMAPPCIIQALLADPVPAAAHSVAQQLLSLSSGGWNARHVTKRPERRNQVSPVANTVPRRRPAGARKQGEQRDFPEEPHHTEPAWFAHSDGLLNS